MEDADSERIEWRRMVIVTVFPIERGEGEGNEAEDQGEVGFETLFHYERETRVFLRLMSPDSLSIGFRVSSLYWQSQKNASDEYNREHLAGLFLLSAFRFHFAR